MSDTRLDIALDALERVSKETTDYPPREYDAPTEAAQIAKIALAKIRSIDAHDCPNCSKKLRRK